LTFGTRAIKVLFKVVGHTPLFKIFNTMLITSFPTICQYSWENKAGLYHQVLELWSGAFVLSAAKTSSPVYGFKSYSFIACVTLPCTVCRTASRLWGELDLKSLWK